MRNLISFITLTALLSGCSPNQFYSVHAQPHKAYDKILVYADYSNLIQKNEFEKAIVDEFSFEMKNIKLWRSIDLFPPLRDYDSNYYAATQQSEGYEAILYCIPEGVSTSTHSTAYRNWFGGISSDSHEQVDAVYSTIILVDARTNQRVYYASFTSVTLLRIMAMDLATDLKKNGYLSSN
jgi:hypothetical protein